MTLEIMNKGSDFLIIDSFSRRCYASGIRRPNGSYLVSDSACRSVDCKDFDTARAKAFDLAYDVTTRIDLKL